MAAVVEAQVIDALIGADPYTVELKLHRRFLMVKTQKMQFLLLPSSGKITTPPLAADAQAKLTLKKVVSGKRPVKVASAIMRLRDIGADTAPIRLAGCSGEAVRVGIRTVQPSAAAAAAVAAPAEADQATVALVSNVVAVPPPDHAGSAEPPLAAAGALGADAAAAVVARPMSAESQVTDVSTSSSGSQVVLPGADAAASIGCTGGSGGFFSGWRRSISRNASRDCSDLVVSIRPPSGDGEPNARDADAGSAPGTPSAVAPDAIDAAASLPSGQAPPDATAPTAAAAAAAAPTAAASSWIGRLKSLFSGSSGSRRGPKHKRTRSEGAALKAQYLARTSLPSAADLAAREPSWRRNIRMRRRFDSDTGSASTPCDTPSAGAAAAAAAASSATSSGAPESKEAKARREEEELERCLRESLACSRGFDKGAEQPDGFFIKTVVSRLNPDAKATVHVRYATFDQTVQLGTGACSNICLLAAQWLLAHPGQVLRPQVMDTLTHRGSKLWMRQVAAEEGASAFSDGHFDIEFALRSCPGIRVRPDSTRFTLLDPAGGELSLVAAAAELPPGVYILGCREHYVQVQVCADGTTYVMDSLGSRLDPGCQLTYLLRFPTTADFAHYYTNVYHAQPPPPPPAAAAAAAATTNAATSGGGSGGGSDGSKESGKVAAGGGRPAKGRGLAGNGSGPAATASNLMREMAALQADIYCMEAAPV